MKTNDR